MQLPMAVIGVETGIFELLAKNEGESFSHAKLTAHGKVDPELMSRFSSFEQHSSLCETDFDA
jgi:hypothetical protein